ncbi:vesicle transport protein SEC20 [Macrosteles quadrilineatus]|uniref:vesicle transport protein SEC20 n=1 Tax=Macrosteles quadrilineatus TaxID=74068 RepID=UPI0023E0F6E9|nr:vesicle transport protein SEC20 [Macrosteles quadrilineatus]
MDSDKYIVESIRQDIVNENLSIKALIQDIHQCSGPMELLDDLNTEGRAKLANLRNHIERLETLAKECLNLEERKELLEEVKNNREQLTSTYGAFRKANVVCMLAIQKINKEQLFSGNDEDSMLRHRLKKDKASLVKMSSSVTEQLLSISRQLADTTQQSSNTLDTLVNSSGNVTGTQQELRDTGSVITQSGKLLAKYGRREFTDKCTILFAFVFFIACVLYIVQKRLF